MHQCIRYRHVVPHIDNNDNETLYSPTSCLPSQKEETGGLRWRINIGRNHVALVECTVSEDTAILRPTRREKFLFFRPSTCQLLRRLLSSRRTTQSHKKTTKGRREKSYRHVQRSLSVRCTVLYCSTYIDRQQKHISVIRI